MASLTQVAQSTRQAIKWGSLLLLFLLAFRWAWQGFWTYWRAKHPPPPPPPTVSFGKLPQIDFPSQDRPQLTYRLETITGTTPDLGDRAPVFFMPVRRPNLLALERAVDQAKKLGFFTATPEKLTATRYRWTLASPLATSLEADIIYGNFILNVDWSAAAEVVSGPKLPNEVQAVLEAQTYLSTTGLLPADLRTGRTRTTFLRAQAGQFIPAVSLSEADFIRVDLFRANLDSGPVVTAGPEEALVTLIFSGNETQSKRLIHLTYNYFPVDYSQSATYPLKTSSQAWDELQSGQGYLASLPPSAQEVIVRRVTLGFFDSPTPQNFLQPVYIFTGDNNFIAYVSALSPDWIQ